MQICVLLFDVQFTIVTLLLLKFTSKLIEPYLSQLYIPWCWAFLLAKNLQSLLFTARRSARIAGAVLDTAIPSVCLSVCQSVRPSATRRYCVKTTARSTVQFALSDSKMCLVL